MSDKKTQILQAAIRLFGEDGVGVATSKIAKKAGVSNGTLFNYFETKQDLIDGVYFYIKERMANEIVSEVSSDLTMKAMFFEIWKLYVLWAYDNPLEHKVLDLLKFSQILSEDVVKAGEHFFASAYDVMDKGIKDKELVDVPMQFYAELTSAQLMAVVHYVREQNLDKDAVNKLIEKSFEIYWSGISRS